MSYYYNYFIGYELDGKIYPWGPYNAEGRLCSALSRSRSHASDLHYLFFELTTGQISDELKKEFECERWDGKKCIEVKYFPIADLPNGDYIKTGYCLIKDVEEYEKNKDLFEGFDDSNVLSPTIYAVKLTKELKFGPNKPQKDEDGNEYLEPNASDYMFYAYPDYNSEEYEASVLRDFATSLYNYQLIDKGAKMVILETEG